ncbi:MAG TPA: glycosyltransferase [Baekduia sp.]|nr:glycosyltransferase [Baekduia sp.]
MTDVAIVAPCPIPYMVGGAENLFRGLQDHLNATPGFRAEILKLPGREHSFWELVDSYRAFAQLDLTGFDVVLSSKYPAWMVRHEHHVVWVMHRLRGLYDTYHFTGLPEAVPDPPPAVEELLAFFAATAGRREALEEAFERLDRLRADRLLTPELEAFPGPLIRAVVHHLDGIGLAPGAIHRYAAISQTVADRPGYFPAGAEVRVAIPPSGQRVTPAPKPLRLHAGRELFTVSRLDQPKRVDLLIGAMAHVRSDVRLTIAGAGPDEERLRALAAGDDRIRFLGRIGDDELVRRYRRCRAVGFVPFEEDLGFITLEAMAAAKPVITATDSGGATELVRDGVNGLVVEPTPEALAGAIDRLWGSRTLPVQMGRAARATAHGVRWDVVVDQLLGA